MRYVTTCVDAACARLVSLTLNNLYANHAFVADGRRVYVCGAPDASDVERFHTASLAACSLWELASHQLRELT